MEKEKEMARYALDYALRKGCQQVRALFSAGEENEVEVRDGKVDKSDLTEVTEVYGSIPDTQQTVSSVYIGSLG